MSSKVEKDGWSIETQRNNEDIDSIDVFVKSITQPSLQYTYTFHYVGNEPYEGFCDPNRWEMLNRRLSYKPSDILIISYPKCGTTWMEQIVLLLLCNGNPDVMNPAFKNAFQAQTHSLDNGLKFGKIWPDVAIEQDPSFQHRMGKQAVPITWEEFENMPVRNRVMKSHSRPKMLLGSHKKGLELLPDGIKVLIITRNPFDACVSSYFYGFNAFRNGWHFDAWANLWLTGLVSMGSWFDFTQEWYEQTQQFPGKALWIHYEDLKESPRIQIERISNYLGISASSEVEYEQLLDRVVQYSSFSSMKEQADQVNCNNAGHVDHHLRKGQCGDWKNFFDINSALYQSFVEKFYNSLEKFPITYKLGTTSADILQTISR